MEVRTCKYFDIYYNPDDPADTKKAEAFIKKLQDKGYSHEVTDDTGFPNLVCAQVIKTKLLKYK